VPLPDSKSGGEARQGLLVGSIPIPVVGRRESADARQADAQDEKERAAVQFARKVVNERGWVSDDDVHQVRQTGYNDGETRSTTRPAVVVVWALLGRRAHLSDHRQRQGLTLADVDERSGMDRSAVSRLENGVYVNPTVDTLYRYAEAIGVEIGFRVRVSSSGTQKARMHCLRNWEMSMLRRFSCVAWGLMSFLSAWWLTLMTSSREIRRLPTVLLFAAVLAVGAGPRVRAADYLWIEGESPQSQTMTRHPWWYDKVKKDQLSGGDFLSNWTDKQPGEATYAFRANAAGEHVLWVRANPVATQLSYQLDGDPWRLIDMKSPQDNVNIAEDGKIDLRFIAWIQVGTVKLTPGAHRIKFKMHSDNNHHGMLDCFVFASGPFTPEGKRKPGEKSDASEVAAEGRWAFQPPRDEFSPQALLDLRNLNEKSSGN
jgi:transcriptional regulator with XRE-family HTH domain